MQPAKKEQKQIQKFSYRQKTVIRFVVGAGIIFILTLLLIIYINLHKTEDTKANTQAEIVNNQKPSDMNIPEVLIMKDTVSGLHSANYKIARPLKQVSTIQ